MNSTAAVRKKDPSIREKHDGKLHGAASLKLWLRLLSCTMVVEKRLKFRLALRGATLPRFDVLAALVRHPEGMAMGALSRSLLVSNGNVTALVQTLLREGHVSVTTKVEDRRISIVRLTEPGASAFRGLAKAHHEWVEAMFGGLNVDQRGALYELLGALKTSIALEP